MVVGVRRTSLCQELQHCWGFHAQPFPVCIKNGPPPNGHPANFTQLWEALESTWAIISVERFQHLVESMPRRIEVVLQINIRKGILMFCTLGVYYVHHTLRSLCLRFL